MTVSVGVITPCESTVNPAGGRGPGSLALTAVGGLDMVLLFLNRSFTSFAGLHGLVAMTIFTN